MLDWSFGKKKTGLDWEETPTEKVGGAVSTMLEDVPTRIREVPSFMIGGAPGVRLQKTLEKTLAPQATPILDKAEQFAIPTYAGARALQNIAVPLIKKEPGISAIKSTVGLAPERSFAEFLPQEFQTKHPIMTEVAKMGIDLGLTGLPAMAKSFTPAELNARIVRRFDTLLENPKYGDAITQAAKKLNTTPDNVHEYLRRTVYSKVKDMPYFKKLDVSLGTAGRARIGKGPRPGEGDLFPKPEGITPTTPGIVPKPITPPETAKQNIITDPARVQEIKNSIAEGEMILKSGKTAAGRKMSVDELGAIQRSVDNEKAKIGEAAKTPTVENKAKEYFGITNDLKKAGYITNDGTLLDLSGENQGNVGAKDRAVDHREINFVTPENDVELNAMQKENPHSNSIGMIWFMNRGNIRLQNNGIDIIQKPNEKQLSTIKEHILQNRGESYFVDISDKNGNTVKNFSYEYPNVKVSTILNDINNYYSKLSPKEGGVARVDRVNAAIAKQREEAIQQYGQSAKEKIAEFKAEPIPTQAKKIIEVPPLKPKKAVTPKTLTGRIAQGGGIDFSKDYPIGEMRQFGLKNTPGARGPDDWAMTLIEEGLLQVPENMNPGDYLMEQLKGKETRQIRGEEALLKEELKKQEAQQKTETAKEQEALKIKRAQEDSKRRYLIAELKNLQDTKGLSNVTISRIKKFSGIMDIKTANLDQLDRAIEYINKLPEGAKLLSEKQQVGLQGIVSEQEKKVLPVIPTQAIRNKYGETDEIMSGRFTKYVINELFPSVDIKEGHPLVSRIVNNAEELLNSAISNTQKRDEEFSKLISEAEKSEKITPLEAVKRQLAPKNERIFLKLSGAPIQLTPQEEKAYQYLKDFFKEAREKLALEKWRKNYITHMEKPLAEKILDNGLFKAVSDIFSLRKQDNIPINIMLELDNIIGSEKFFKYALERKGGMDYTTNLRKILHEYSQLYETKIALDRILPEGQAVTQLLLQPKTAQWMKRYLQNLKGRALDFNFRSGKMRWLSQIADRTIDLSYIKLLGINYISAIKNLLAGEVNSFIYQSFFKYLKGKERLISSPKKAYKIALDYGVLEGTYADFAGSAVGALRKAGQVIMIGQRLGEIEIRTSLFISNLTDEEWKSGVISAERVRQLKDEIAITQGIFSKTETPLWMQTWYGRMLMQMNRWRITNAMMLRRIALGAKEEISKGDYKGTNTRRLLKALIIYGMGMYVSVELGKAGYKKAASVAKSSAELINSAFEIVGLKPITDALTNNPTISTLKEFMFTLQELAYYVGMPGAQKPQPVVFQKGIEKTFIAPVQRTKELLGIPTTAGKKKRKATSGLVW